MNVRRLAASLTILMATVSVLPAQQQQQQAADPKTPARSASGQQQQQSGSASGQSGSASGSSAVETKSSGTGSHSEKSGSGSGTAVRMAEVVKMFQLQNAIAEDVKKALTNLLADDVRVAVDPRSNALIVRGRDEDLQTAEAIVRRMDEAEAIVVPWRKYEPKNVNISMLEKTVRKMFPRIEVQADERSKKLFYAASENEVRRVEELMKEIDVKQIDAKVERPKSPPLPDRQLRVIWLVEKETADSTGDDIPEDLKATVAKLKAKTKITEMKTGAQFVVNVAAQEGYEFEVFGTSDQSEVPCRVNCAGGLTIEEDVEKPRMHFSAVVLPVRSQDEKDALSKISAQIVIGPDRPIVLGMSTVNGKASIFVVELLPREE